MDRIFISTNLLSRCYVLVSLLALNRRYTFFASPPQTSTPTPPHRRSRTPCLLTLGSIVSAMPVFELPRLRLPPHCQQLVPGAGADRSPSRMVRPCQPERLADRQSLSDFLP